MLHFTILSPNNFKCIQDIIEYQIIDYICYVQLAYIQYLTKKMALRNYIQELKKRNVFRVAITYGITAWLILQIAETVIPIIDAPIWILKLILIMLLVGFPVAIIFAWAYEMSPTGIIRTESSKAKKSADSSVKKKHFTSNYIIGVLIILVIGQFLYNKYFDDSSDIISNNEDNIAIFENSIAVLPLINISGDESLDYFSDGVTNEIITELAKINTFILTAFSSSYQYKSKKDKPRTEIAQELNVKYLIQGSAKIYKDSVYLSIELINPISNQQIWNGRYNVLLDNSPKLQSTIAKNVARSLNIEISPEERKSLEKVNTVDGEAFKLFLQAKKEIVKLTKQGFNNGEKFLKEAIRLDPNYSQAHTLLAWNYTMGGVQWVHGNTISSFETKSFVAPLLNRAIELDPLSSDIYLVRGNYNMNIIGHLQDAKKDVEHALELNSWPRVPTNYCICTVVSLYVAIGEIEKAKEYVKLSRSVDPENIFIHFDEGLIYLVEGEIKKAQALFKKAVDVSDVPLFNFFYGWSFYHNDELDESIKILERAYHLDKEPIALTVAYLSNAHYKVGNQTESERYRLELKERHAQGEHHISLSLAMVELGRNNKEEALGYLEESILNRDSGSGYLINIDPIFKSLYNEPRFIEIRKKLQYYE